MNMECSVWRTRPTEPIFILEKNLPVSAMAAGADMAAVSMHKSGGSLTQSSVLLLHRPGDERGTMCARSST